MYSQSQILHYRCLTLFDYGVEKYVPIFLQNDIPHDYTLRANVLVLNYVDIRLQDGQIFRVYWIQYGTFQLSYPFFLV